MALRRFRPAWTVLGRVCLAILIATAATHLSWGSSLEEALRPAHVPGEVLVKFRPDAPAPAVVSIRAQFGARTLRRFRAGGERWALGPGHTEAEAIDLLRRSPLVAYAEPNYIVSLTRSPNDPRYGELYGLHNVGQNGGTPGADIDAERAWDISTGSPSVVVAVIDTGVDYTHPDLAANIWTNPGEIPGNGIDDDGDGYVDDVHGWDFHNNDNDPMDDHSHGTHVSGTIAAIGDNAVGVVGVTWSVKILPVKFLGADGSGTTDGAIASIEYATDRKVDVMSNSWGGGGFSQALLDAIKAASDAGILFVAAAGNSASDNDVYPFYPSNYDAPNVVAVAATDRNDALAYFSDYGATTVHLGAPGVDTLSCVPGASYGTKSGTSMATPHVSGVAALIRSIAPGIDVAHLKARLLASVDPVPSLAGRTVTGGRVNAFLAIADPDSTPPAAVSDLAVTGSTSNSLVVSWTAPGDDGEIGRATAYEVRSSDAPIDEDNFPLATLAPAPPVPGASGHVETLEIGGLSADHTSYVALKTKDEWGNASALSNVASGRTLPPPTFASSPPSFDFALLTGGSGSAVLTLRNAGVGTLDWSVDPPLRGPPPPPPPPAAPSPAKNEPDARVGPPVVADAGGPDAFGYRFVDSNEPGGPAFVWNDIAATGTPITSLAYYDDKTSEPIALGFSFPFYGTTFDSVRVCTNGWLSFTNAGAAAVNQPLPSAAAPEYLVAPFWDDLFFNGASSATTSGDGTSFTVQYTNVSSLYYGGSYTFQVTLFASGAIEFRYKSMLGAVNNATVGIQDGTTTVGLQVVFNNAYVKDGLAVRIDALADWLTVAPRSGRLNAGEQAPLDVTVDATGLDGGVYQSAIVVHTNDPAHPSVSHPVNLTVTGAPDIHLAGAEHVVSSTATYSVDGAVTAHALPVTVAPAGSGRLDLTANGDYGDPPETATATAEGLILGSVGATGYDCTPARRSFTLGAADLATLAADGVVNVRVQNSPDVNVFCAENSHTVTLSYRGSADTLDFGDLFVGAGRQLSLDVENLGSATLDVSEIAADSGAFTVSAPSMSVPAHGSQSLSVTFTPPSATAFSGTLRLSSNDPDTPAVTVSLSGTGQNPPVIGVSPSSLSSTQNEGHEETQTLTIANGGGSPLTYSIAAQPAAPTIHSEFGGLSQGAATTANVPPGSDGTGNPAPTAAPEGSWRAQAGEFQSLRSSPVPLTCVVGDGTGIVYAQANFGTAFYRYVAATDTWESLASAPIDSGNNGGAALLAGRIYTVTTGSSQMGIYDIASNTWTMTGSPLGRGTGNIATDGAGLLFLALGAQVVSFDPATGAVATLPPPPISFQPWGGLQWSQGILYGHEGNGNFGFEAYDTLAGTWTALPRVPAGAVLGSAIDPYSGDYYAYGSYGGQNLYRYSIAKNLWSVLTIPTFYVSDGGLAFLPGPTPGIVIVQGEQGTGVARFVTTASGITVSPQSGTIPAGASAAVAVRFDAITTPPGTYGAKLHVVSNDPLTPALDVPASFTVVAHPRIQLDRGAIDFGAVFIGGSTDRSLVVRNLGSVVLDVSEIATDQGAFTVSAPSLHVPPHGSQTLTVSFAPTSADAFSGSLTLTSNDPETPVTTASLSGAGRLAPVIGVSPGSMESTLNEGLQETRTLTISNTGGNDLSWQLTFQGTPTSAARLIPPPVIPPPSTSDTAPEGFQSVAAAPSRVAGARVLLVQDVLPWGSDADQQVLAADGLAYDIVHASALASTDLAPYSLLIVPSDQYGSTYSILASQMPKIEAFVAGGGTLEFHAAAWGWNGGDASSVVLPDGMRIQQRYASTNHVADPSHPIMAGVPEPFMGNSASHAYFTAAPARAKTIATDDLYQPTLVEYVHGAGLVVASAQPLEYYYGYGGPIRQILVNMIPYSYLAAPRWISLSPLSGTVPPGGSVDVAVTFDARTAAPGTYGGKLHVVSDDPLTPVVDVPASLTIIGHPRIQLDRAAIDFGSTFVGGHSDQALVIQNLGSITLEVSEIASDQGAFSVSAPSMSVPAHESRTLRVQFAPPAAVPFSGTLRIASNDADTPVLTVLLSGTGLLAPVIGVSPPSMSSTLDEGHEETQTLTIANAGGSPLTYSIAALPSGATAHSDFAGLAQGSPAPPNVAPSSGGPAAGPQVAAAPEGSWQAQSGEFQSLRASPVPLTCVVGDGAGILYAQANAGTAFYRYVAGTDTWESLAPAPVFSGNNGGAALLNGRIYTVYTGTSQMGIYDIASNTWTMASSPLGEGTGNIAADGSSLLYLAADIHAVSFDPATGRVTVLPTPPIYFQLWGGLQWFQGVLYGHQGNNGAGFAAYDTTAGSWSMLPSLPAGAVLGSAIDPFAGDYYAYGSYGGQNLYRYSISKRSWSVLTIPNFYVNDGGLVFLPGPTPGILIVQGETGSGFARFVTAAAGISVSPPTGSIDPGASAAIGVQFDARTVPPGTYGGRLHVTSNDPVTPALDVPTSFTIVGHPRIRVDRAAIDFGPVFVGASSGQSLFVQNIGSADLHLSSVTSDEPSFTPSPFNYPIPPHLGIPIGVLFTPSREGTFAATLTIASDDPDAPLVHVSLTGEGRIPPRIGASPSPLSAVAYPGQIVTRSLTVTNTGGSDLSWQATIRRTVAASASVLIVEDVFPWGNTSIQQVLRDNGLAYDVVTSYTLAGTDLSPYRLLIVPSDQYTSTYSNLAAQMSKITQFVSSGGVLEFHAAGWGYNGGNASLVTLPGAVGIEQLYAGTNYVVAPSHPIVAGVPATFFGTWASHADFLNVPATATTIVTNDVSRPTLVEYPYGGGLVIASGNTLEYYYPYGGPIRQILINTIPYAYAAVAPWIAATPISGTVPAGGSAGMTVTFDATRLSPGDLSASIDLSSNDPLTPVLTVPVAFHVVGRPDIDVTPAGLAFGTVFIGYPQSLPIRVANLGTEPLHVSSITAGDPAVSVDAASFTVDPHSSRQVLVSIRPDGVRTIASSLTIASDDPDHPSWSVGVSGNAIPAPHVAAAPLTVEATELAGRHALGKLTLRNTGGSDLSWSLAIPTGPPAGASAGVELQSLPGSPETDAGSRALLVEDLPPWNTASNEQVLAANHIPYDVVPVATLASVDLSRYHLVIVAGDQSNAFYAALSPQMTRLESYVSDGGVLEFHADGWASHGGDPSGINLPGSMRILNVFATTNYVTNADHPIVAGVPSAFVGHFASHAVFTSVAAGADVVATNDTGRPTLVQYGYGRGAVIAAAQTLEYYYYNGGPIGTILSNMIPYAFGRSPALEWLTIPVSIGILPAGQSVDLDLVFNGAGQAPGEYANAVELATNDPDAPSTTVTARFHVLRLRADAGPDQSLECTGGGGAAVLLDGSGSDHMSGPGAITRYAWSEGGSSLGEGATLGLRLPVGGHDVALRIEDATGAASEDGVRVAVVDSKPPAGSITFPSTGACFGPSSLPIVVSDTFADACYGAVLRTYDPPGGSVVTAHGDHVVQLVASDASGNAAAPARVSFTIDTVPPAVTIIANPATLQLRDLIPFSSLFTDSDTDGATGGVIHETVAVDGCVAFDGLTYGNRDGLLSDETIAPAESTLCHIAQVCGRRRFTNPVIAVTATDCGGNGTTASVSLAGDFLASDCELTGGLTLAKQPGGAHLTWAAVTGASGYQVVRGDLSILRAGQGAYHDATDHCLANAAPPTSLDDPAAPAPGSGFYYLVRDVTDGVRGSWDEPAASQVGSRDAAIDSSPGACP